MTEAAFGRQGLGGGVAESRFSGTNQGLDLTPCGWLALELADANGQGVQRIFSLLAGFGDFVDVSDDRSMPVEEILRRLQAFEDDQARRLVSETLAIVGGQDIPSLSYQCHHLLGDLAAGVISGSTGEPVAGARAVALHPVVILGVLTAGTVVVGLAGAFLAVPLFTLQEAASMRSAAAGMGANRADTAP